jgi:hypothetical protein
MYFPRDPDSALFVQAHSGATPPNPFFQERKETLIPRWGHTPSVPHTRFFPEPNFLAGDLPPLAQRLERRKQPSLLLHGTVDSWDFPTILHAPSPIQSVFRRLRHSSASLDEAGGPNEQAADAKQPNEPNVTMSADTERETTLTSATSCSPPNAGESRPPLQPNRVPKHTPSSVGYVATSSSADSGPENWTNPASPFIAVPVSASSNQTSSSPSSSPSLWRRIRRSTGHSDDGAWVRSTFIDSVLQRGKGGP